MKQGFVLYGANGYTGRLIAEMAVKAGGPLPILAGRNSDALKAMSVETGCPFRVVDINDAAGLDALLADAAVVLHSAGPFRNTSRQMLEACIRTGTHYTDITGEISVFEACKRQDQRAREAGIMVMPGVGFDVVPTDSLAAYLKERLPDATSLKLAFASLGGRYSRGTATTMTLGAGEPSAERKDGRIVPVPLGKHSMWVDFGPKRLFVMSIPWGDVSTAYTTTSIPDIVTYTGVAPGTHKLLRYQSLFNWLLRTSFFRERRLRKIQAGPAGPSPEQRARSRSLVWGEVRNASGHSCRARLTGPEGYTLTAMAALHIVGRILSGDLKTGYQTPAGCYGPELVMHLEGVTREDC